MCVWKNVFDFFLFIILIIIIIISCSCTSVFDVYEKYSYPCIFIWYVCAWMRGRAQFFFFTFLVAARYLPFSSYTHHNLRYFPFGGYVIKFVRFWCALLKYLPFHWITCALWISKLINTFKYMFLWMFFVSFVQFILISDFLSLSPLSIVNWIEIQLWDYPSKNAHMEHGTNKKWCGCWFFWV